MVRTQKQGNIALRFHIYGCMRRVSIMVFLTGFSISAMAGGPWLQKKGNGYFQVGGSSKSWDGRYQGGYSSTFYRDLNRDITEGYLAFYGEYGISEKLTLIADVPWRFQISSDDLNEVSDSIFSDTLSSGNLSALANPSIALKYPLKTEGLNISVQMKIWANLSSYDVLTGLRSDYDAFSYSPSIIFGKSGTKHYWSFDIGPVIRSNGYGESVTGNFQYGYSLWKKSYAILDINYLVAFENGTYNNESSAHTGTFLDNQGYVSYGLKVYQRVTKSLSFNVAAYSGFAVINQGTQPRGYFGGIAYELVR